MPSHILKSTIQSGALSALSNVLAQGITAWRSGSPMTLNITRLLQFVTFSVLSCPPNCMWQAWLEAQFPAHTDRLEPSEKKDLVDDATTGQGTGTQLPDNSDVRRRPIEQKTMTEGPAQTRSGKTGSTKRLNVVNTAIKFTLDQTLGAAVNTVLFIAGIAFLRGQDAHSIYHDIETKFWPMMFAGQKLWPAVSILSFTVIPLEQRMLFGSVAGLFWGVYLSLAAGSGKS